MGRLDTEPHLTGETLRNPLQWIGTTIRLSEPIAQPTDSCNQLSDKNLGSIHGSPYSVISLA